MLRKYYFSILTIPITASDLRSGSLNRQRYCSRWGAVLGLVSSTFSAWTICFGSYNIIRLLINRIFRNKYCDYFRLFHCLTMAPLLLCRLGETRNFPSDQPHTHRENLRQRVKPAKARHHSETGISAWFFEMPSM